jgi:hypothetical protein
MGICEYTGKECEYAEMDEEGKFEECLAVFIEQCPIGQPV